MLSQKEDTYFALARKWRPQQFDEVIGQEHITRTLKNAVSSGRIHHALLFIGSRGVGKTTTARILAKALNCLSSDKPTPTPCDRCSNCIDISRGSHLDVQEIDGASNNSVENVRDIREAVRLAPANARYKVYIIDEVHQLSSSAFNALLKTLEEPPSHAVFVLATTEAHKVPATIISRCQRFDFRRVSVHDIVKLLEKIVIAEKRKATKEALYAIARVADGAVRDAESILDQLMTYCTDEITYKDVHDVLGLIEVDKIYKFVEVIRDRKLIEILRLIDELVVSGKDLYLFIDELISLLRNMLILKATHNPDVLCLPKEDIERLKSLSDGFTTVQLIRLVEQLASISQNFASQISHRTVLEAFFVKYCKVGVDISIESILEKLISLEGYLKEGITPDSKVIDKTESGVSKNEGGSFVKKNSSDVQPSKEIYLRNSATIPGSGEEQGFSPKGVKEDSASVRKSEHTPTKPLPLWDVIFNMFCSRNPVFAVKLTKVKSADYDEANKTLILHATGDHKEILELLEKDENVELFKKICEKLKYKVEKVILKQQEQVNKGNLSDTGLKAESNSRDEKNSSELPSHLVEMMNIIQGSIVGVIDKQEPEELSTDETELEEEDLGENE